MASLPLYFEANHGQVDPAVMAYARKGGVSIYLTGSEVLYSLSRPKDSAKPEPKLDPLGDDRDRKAQEYESAVIRMGFVGANSDPEVAGEGKLEGKTNYFLGNDPSKWVTEVPTYSQMRYVNLYDGIDLVFYENDAGELEHDFVVAPGADPSKIKLALTGTEDLSISDDGSLRLTTSLGEISQSAPRTYQDVSGDRREIESRYAINEATGEVGYELGNYDTTHPIVIDPSLVYSSYLGGSNNEYGLAIAVDISGTAYVSGATPSTNFPTQDPYQVSNAGGANDVFATKVAPDGQSMIYSSYLGGSGADVGYAVAASALGSAYLTGWTSSANFPTASPFQPMLSAGRDTFIAKLSSSGSVLEYSSYLGGTSNDYGYSLALDQSMNAYIGGATESIDFPTASPFQPSKAGGGFDAYVAKVNDSGPTVSFSSYLGGASNDEALGIIVDSSANAFVTGRTDSTDFPNVSSFQGSRGGSYDAFVTKVNTLASSIAYSSFLGGSSWDEGHGISIDSSENAFVVGQTAADFPTVLPWQGANAGGNDAFVSKVAANGQSLSYSTYLGGSGSDIGKGISTDGNGAAYISGYTQSANFPSLGGPFQSTYGGNGDVFVTQFAADGQTVIYSSYLGGSQSDDADDIAFDSAGAAYLTGFTASSDFPIAGSPFQPVFGGGVVGGGDAFVVKVGPGSVTISGTFAGGTWGSIAIYDATSGNLVAYSCCMTDSTWAVSVPPASCPSGYKVLYIAPNESIQFKWFDSKDNWSSADCVSAPSSGNDMTIPSAGAISGYVKDASTAADISGASIYAFKASDGTYAGYTRSGTDGRYEFNLSTSETYKLLVHPGASYVNQWFSGAPNYTEATPQAPPATANFSVTAAGVIDGYVKDATTAADLNGYPVYAYTPQGSFFAYGVTDRGYGQGRYRITVNPGETYRLVSTGGPYATQWYSGATSFSTATDNAAPFTANFSR